MQVQFLSQEDSPGGGPSNPLQYSSLKNPMYRGVWQAIVYEVSKNCTWQVTLHTQARTVKRYKLKSAEAKGARRRVQERPGGSFQGSLPAASYEHHSILLATTCDNTVSIAREAPVSLGVQDFYCGSVMQNGHVTDLSYSPPSTTRSQADTMWGPSSQVNKDSLIRQDKGFEVMCQEPVMGQSSLQNTRGLSIPRLLSSPFSAHLGCYQKASLPHCS